MSPFLLFATLVIILEDGIPVFFIQERVGKNNKTFKIFKIRTLKKMLPIREHINWIKNISSFVANFLEKLNLMNSLS